MWKRLPERLASYRCLSPMSTPCQHEIPLTGDGDLAINVARWATSPTSVELLLPEVNEQIIDNAAPGRWDILHENANLDSSPLALVNRVRETTKGRPITRPGVSPRKYGLAYQLCPAYCGFHQDTRRFP